MLTFVFHSLLGWIFLHTAVPEVAEVVEAVPGYLANGVLQAQSVGTSLDAAGVGHAWH